MTRRVEQGTIVYGFAHGHFGRDSYGDKVCIQTGFYGGYRWALFHEQGSYSGGAFHTLYGRDLEDLEADDEVFSPEPDL